MKASRIVAAGALALVRALRAGLPGVPEAPPHTAHTARPTPSTPRTMALQHSVIRRGPPVAPASAAALALAA